MKILRILLPLLLFCYSYSAAQNRAGKGAVVDSIKIFGNEITEDEIILRELNFKKGDLVTADDIKFNRERIFSLSLFTKVELSIDSTGSRNILVIDVEESWYIYPIPFAELKDKDWKKLSYGIDLLYKNFRGRNETLRARGAFGYDPSYLLSYSNPLLFPEEDVFFRTEFFYTDVLNKSSGARNLIGGDFEQKFISGAVIAGKRLNVYNRISFALKYNYIETPFYVKGINASGSRIDRIPAAAVEYSYDSRDLSYFPREGILFYLGYIHNGFGNDGISYHVASFDFREYRMLWGDLSAKWRLSSRFAFGADVPYYDYSFLGFGEKVRGHYRDEREGHYSYLGSLEFTYPIIEELNIKLDFVPVIPNELLHYRVALYSQVFTDAGTVRSKSEGFSLNNFYSGYGAGLTLLILPYNIVRVEFALDEHRNLEWIFDVGISF